MDIQPGIEEQEESSSLATNSNLTAGSIQAIDKGSVHRICSGQVVLNLATAVKELVENSLDAGATSIEVRLKEYGSECIEVVDNGSGVEPCNFAGLTLKHHTSKLRDFSDLTQVDTFGFRGEALSSLCALSKLQITTRHKDAQVAMRLEFDHSGKLLSTTPCARQCGTTVTIENLFSTLPVRHREFQRNLKREFSKMAQVLSGYGIISTKVRLHCTNTVGKGKKNTIVSTNGNETMKENITNIFGAKQVSNILDIVQTRPSEEVCSEYNLKPEVANSSMFKLAGYVSTCAHGQGRSSADRQFFFINQRPCDLTKVARVVNEVYHAYNRHQYPFIVLDISLDKESVDVNVTPDKRQIFLENEKLLLACIKTSLQRVLEPHASVYAVNRAPVQSHTITSMFSTPQLQPAPKLQLTGQSSCPDMRNEKFKSITATLANLKRSFSSAFSKPDHEEPKQENQSKQRKLDNFVVAKKQSTSFCYSNSDTLKNASQSSTDTDSCIDLTSSQEDIANGVSLTGNTDMTNEKSNSLSSSQTSDSLLNFKIEFNSEAISESVNANPSIRNELEIIPRAEMTPENKSKSSEETTHNYYGLTYGNKHSFKQEAKITITELSLKSEEKNISTELHKEIKTCDGDITSTSRSLNQVLDNTDEGVRTENLEADIVATEVDTKQEVHRKEKTVSFSLTSLKSRLNSLQGCKKKKEDNSWCRNFRAKINPSENEAAEEELKKTISKDMFPKMDILGQFNLGFIIARLGQDLFIIDQHATDEKYNFEMLQRHTVIDSQKLIQPQQLELTAANESILFDNVDVFHSNGFDLLIDHEALPTQRVRLASKPVSKNWEFGKDDIDELLFMLSDSPGVMCRPSRVRAMFASRACRKSIMIGTALNHSQMSKLVRHMAEIDQPWNCPHGRPTMRHLINLDMLPTSQ